MSTGPSHERYGGHGTALTRARDGSEDAEFLLGRAMKNWARPATHEPLENGSTSLIFDHASSTGGWDLEIGLGFEAYCVIHVGPDRVDAHLMCTGQQSTKR